MKKYFNFFLILVFFSSIQIQNTFARGGNSEDAKYDQFYLDKLKDFEESQIDLDLIFAEYCYFNRNDPKCYEDKNESNDSQNEDTALLEQSEIFYTTVNVNLREKPNTNSKVITVILKNEPVEVYKVSDQNSNWFYIKYNNEVGFVYGDYLSKEKSIAKQILPSVNEEDVNLDAINELKIEMSNMCNDNFILISSYNTRKTHQDYCSCYTNKLISNLDENEILYLVENEEFTGKFYEEAEKMQNICMNENNFVDNLFSDEEDWINENIDICFDDYDSDSVVSFNDYKKTCQCYYNKRLFIINDADQEYFEKYNELSANEEKNTEELMNECMSGIL